MINIIINYSKKKTLKAYICVCFVYTKAFITCDAKLTLILVKPT